MLKLVARTGCEQVRERLKDSVLFEGVHYIRPFGGRKILFLWEKIEEDMGSMASQSFAIQSATASFLFR